MVFSYYQEIVMSPQIVSFTLHAGQSISDGVDCTAFSRVARLVMPDDWTLAPLSFQLSPDGVDYHDLYHVTGDMLQPFEISVPNPKAGSALAFPSDMGADVPWFRVRSGTRAAPVAQQADRTFTLILEAA
jgi:hypothetical protein